MEIDEWLHQLYMHQTSKGVGISKQWFDLWKLPKTTKQLFLPDIGIIHCKHNDALSTSFYCSRLHGAPVALAGSEAFV